MAGKKSVIETGVDKLVRLIAERNKVSVKDAAKELGVSVTSIEDWADFLEEEGIINIQSQFATVYLVEKKISKKELAARVKAVKNEKEQFLNRIESSVNALARDHDEIKLVDSEFQKIKGLLEENFSKLSKKLEKLEDFRKSHRELDMKRKEIEDEYEAKISAVEEKLKKEQKQYQDLIASMGHELDEMKKEEQHLDSMKKSEKELESQVTHINGMLDQVRKEIKNGNAQLEADEARLKKNEDVAKKVKSEIESDSKEIDEVSAKLKESHKELTLLEKEFFKDIESLGKGDLNKIGAYKEGKELIERFQKFFTQTKEVDRLIVDAEKEEADLRNEFDKMLKKARAFSVVTSVPEIRKELGDLQEELKVIESKKSLLSNQLKKLRSAMRSVVEK